MGCRPQKHLALLLLHFCICHALVQDVSEECKDLGDILLDERCAPQIGLLLRDFPVSSDDPTTQYQIEQLIYTMAGGLPSSGRSCCNTTDSFTEAAVECPCIPILIDGAPVPNTNPKGRSTVLLALEQICNVTLTPCN
ncbi:hypothetical protein ACKKBG_A22975 [Auxenochlorella protothecoides x Auxenochlorella symbiontica]